MIIIDETDARPLTKAELGQVIRYLRELRQWSQETLAELAHSTPRTIQRVEAGSGASISTLRSLASAFDYQDIDIFSKPLAIPTDEQLQEARDQFNKDYIMSKALQPKTGRCLAMLVAETIGDYIEPAFELSRDQAVTFAELTDYLREYRDYADCCSSTSRLEVFDELQAMLDRLGEQGVTLRYATTPVVQRNTSEIQQETRPIGKVLDLIAFKAEDAPEELALPRRMGIG